MIIIYGGANIFQVICETNIISIHKAIFENDYYGMIFFIVFKLFIQILTVIIKM